MLQETNMKYKINIQIINQRGDELLDKHIKITDLDNILDLDLSAIYAEAQQNELTDSPIEYDETIELDN